jgi:hypothetical protein
MPHIHYDNLMSRRASAEGEQATNSAAGPIDLGARHAARLFPSGYAAPPGSGLLPVTKIVDVFVRDHLKGSYPVVIECQGSPAEDAFVDQVRNGMDRGFYSADDIKVAKFVVRET